MLATLGVRGFPKERKLSVQIFKVSQNLRSILLIVPLKTREAELVKGNRFIEAQP
jgi:hypothetical protein